jgi:hypothetical protein
VHPLFGGVVLDELGEPECALIADPDPGLHKLWTRLVEHAEAMIANGWNPEDAYIMVADCVLAPLSFGCADGSFNRRIRARVNQKRRKEAATLARRLAAMLDRIRREPLARGGVFHWRELIPNALLGLMRGPPLPSAIELFPTSDALRRLAAELDTTPDFAAEGPSIASQIPSWRDYLRDVAARLDRLGFALREVEAVRLMAAVARATGRRVAPSRDVVRAALRGLATR